MALGVILAELRPALPFGWNGELTWSEVTVPGFVEAADLWPVRIEDSECFDPGSEHSFRLSIFRHTRPNALASRSITLHPPLVDWLPLAEPHSHGSCPRGRSTGLPGKHALPADSRLEAEPWQRPCN